MPIIKARAQTAAVARDQKHVFDSSLYKWGTCYDLDLNYDLNEHTNSEPLVSLSRIYGRTSFEFAISFQAWIKQ